MTVISILKYKYTSFSDIKNAYKNSNDTNGGTNSSLRDGYTTTEISLNTEVVGVLLKGIVLL